MTSNTKVTEEEGGCSQLAGKFASLSADFEQSRREPPKGRRKTF